MPTFIYVINDGFVERENLHKYYVSEGHILREFGALNLNTKPSLLRYSDFVIKLEEGHKPQYVKSRMYDTFPVPSEREIAFMLLKGHKI